MVRLLTSALLATSLVAGTAQAVTPIYLPGTLPFCRNVPLIARGTVRDLEPSIRVDVRGNCYVGGIRGVPAGVDMWRIDLDPSSPTFDPELRSSTYLGQPDAFSDGALEDSLAGGADGGGDIEFAMSYPTSPDSAPVVTMVSLALATISSHASFDRGATWMHQFAASGVPADDRQWIDTDGPNDVYLFYRAPIPATALFVQRSTDHGLSYGAPTLVSPTGSSPGYVAVDHANGNIYVSHTTGTTLMVSRSTNHGTSFSTVTVDATTAHGRLFDPIKVGRDGTVYVAWTDLSHVYMSYSTNGGVTWAPKIRVDNGSAATTAFPWLEAGDAGRVDVVWFGTVNTNSNFANWDVHFMQTLDALSATPTFKEQIISDHTIHGSNISVGGLTGAANRNLGDYFQIAYDPQGAAVVAFADDHNDADGATYVVRQLGGTGLLAAAGGGTGTVATVASTPMPVFTQDMPEVVDPAHDAIARVQPIPTDNPFDITSIKYFSDNNGPNAPYFGARMKLSGLTTMPPGGNWRIVFAVDAPQIVDQRPTGVPDHGKYFYMLAADTGATPTFTYGTGYRDSTPLLPAPAGVPFAMAYAFKGMADSGYVDSTTSTVTIKISLAKINALLPGPYAPLGPGSWVGGLRGNAFGPNNIPSDGTRGGRYNFRFQALDPAAVTPPPPAGFNLAVGPSPSRGPADVDFALSRGGPVRLGVYDVAGREVRSLVATETAPGQHRVRWDGRDREGRDAAAGVYYIHLRSPEGEKVARMVRVR